ncbi:hypothetical protein [Aurantimonas sp. HBX-1]|uniref:hypothetical protein n=1 Tax=Aurantimonas sp. HBX-1 TaxID=2906072 RepID=UPI001F41F53E|nr:hypothetical protein [Aurantimonas sp. HBX-1]UIJ73294.1 hypothetical protein LXB15_06525 [Aurantimonas sp. HBX-1]
MEPRLGPADILVCLAEDLSDRHLDAIEVTVGPSVPGIIVGRDRAELRDRAAASCAALNARPSAPPLRVEIVPHLPIGLVRGDHYAVAGRNADPPALRRMLGQGDSLVSVTGHGDGIDGDLGPLVLCPLDRDFLTGRTARPPTCRVSGHCHRCDTELQSQTLEARQLHPNAIRARAMIWNTCVGWPSRDSFVERTFGAGLRLAASARIGALITTSRISLASSVTVDALASALMRGVPLGEAVARHNASPAARRAGHRLLLFGDPLLRIAPTIAGETPELAPSPSRPALQPAPRGAAHAPAASPADARLAATMARLQSGANAHRQADFADICRALAREGLEGLWARQGLGSGTEDAPCPHCRAPAHRHALLLAAGATRHLLICRRCEVAADTPERPEIAVRLQAGGIGRITAFRPAAGTAWLGTVVLRRCAPYATETQPWPPAANGGPAGAVDLRRDSTEAPTTLAAVFLVGGSLHVFSRPYAAGALTSGRPTPAAPA